MKKQTQKPKGTGSLIKGPGTFWGCRGFTLMETLLAVTLFTIVAVSSMSIFSMGLQIWKRARGASTTERKALLMFEKMGQDLRGMARIPAEKKQFSIQENIAFEYQSDSDEIMIPALYNEIEGGVMAGYGRTTYKWNAATQEVCRSTETAADLFQKEKSQCRVMAREVARFKIRYWLSSGLVDSYSWYDSWDPEDGMPLAVQIQMELKPETPSAARRVYQKTVLIPAGGKIEPPAA